MANRVLVTGATSFLGFRVVATLLAQGDVSVGAIVHPDQMDKVSLWGEQVKIQSGDVWNRPSLKGLSRGYQTVIHLVGSLKADPMRGLTYQQINLLSARNVIGMAVGDGVLNVILLSVAAFPFSLPSEYMRSKRESEEYLSNSGLEGIILRLPSLYAASLQTPFLNLMSLGHILPFLGRYMPLGVEVAARGIASLAINPDAYQGKILYANHLRRLARKIAPLKTSTIRPAIVSRQAEDQLENVPFGWLPPPTGRRRRF